MYTALDFGRSGAGAFSISNVLLLLLLTIFNVLALPFQFLFFLFLAMAHTKKCPVMKFDKIFVFPNAECLVANKCSRMLPQQDNATACVPNDC